MPASACLRGSGVGDAGATERLAHYLARAPVTLGKVHPQPEGRIKLLTPPDPASGRDHKHFYALDWVHAITTQIPDARQHMVRLRTHT